MRKIVIVFGFFTRTSLITWLVLTATFFLFQYLPTDPAIAALGPNTSEEAINEFRETRNLNQDLGDRYRGFLLRAAQLDLGLSYRTGEDVLKLVLAALTNSLKPIAVALPIAALLSILLTWLAWQYTLLSSSLKFIARCVSSVPSIVLSVIVGLLVYTTWPAAGQTNYVNTSLAIGVVPLALLADLGLSRLSNLRFGTAAIYLRSIGMNEQFIFFQSVLPSILGGWSAILSNLAASMITLIVAYEIVFSIDGMGLVFYNALIYSDLPMMQGFVLVTLLMLFTSEALFWGFERREPK